MLLVPFDSTRANTSVPALVLPTLKVRNTPKPSVAPPYTAERRGSPTTTGCPFVIYRVIKSVIKAISTKVATVLTPDLTPNERAASRKRGILKKSDTVPMGKPFGKASKIPLVKWLIAILIPYTPPGTMPAGALNRP